MQRLKGKGQAHLRTLNNVRSHSLARSLHDMPLLLTVQHASPWTVVLSCGTSAVDRLISMCLTDMPLAAAPCPPVVPCSVENGEPKQKIA